MVCRLSQAHVKLYVLTSQVVSNALVCIVAESTAPLGLLKLKLNALRAHLSGALAPIFNAA